MITVESRCHLKDGPQEILVLSHDWQPLGRVTRVISEIAAPWASAEVSEGRSYGVVWERPEDRVLIVYIDDFASVKHVVNWSPTHHCFVAQLQPPTHIGAKPPSDLKPIETNYSVTFRTSMPTAKVVSKMSEMFGAAVRVSIV